MANYEEPITTFASRLNYTMSLRGVTQAELARKTKMAEASISQYATGKFTPRSDKLYVIAKALDVAENWLLGFDVPMERKVGKAVQSDFEIYIDKQTKDMIEAFVELNQPDREMLIEFARRLLEDNKNEQ